MTGPQDEPNLTPLAIEAAGFHEMFLAFHAAGFTVYQALWMTGAMAKGLPIPDWISAPPAETPN